MKALILNSGAGRRFKPLTNLIPKCLIKLNEKTILEHQLEILESYSIKEFIITTGPFENKIKEVVSKSFKNLTVIYIHNPKFDSTNYIYSMWLAKDIINDDILLLHGDLFFENIVIEKIINQQNNSVILYKLLTNAEKDFKAVLEQGTIKKINVNLTGDNVYYLMPLYFWTKKGILKWYSEIDKFIQEGLTNCYAEDAFNVISEDLQLHPLFLKKEFCMEIDTIDDLKRVKKFLLNTKKP